MTLEQIPDDKSPTVDSDVREYWWPLGKLVALYNALLNFQIRFDTGRNRFTITEGNAVLELSIPAISASGPADFTPSDASTSAGAKLGLTNGNVQGVMPAGMTVGATTTFTIPVTVSGVAWLKVVFDTAPASTTYAAVTAVTVEVGATLPTDTDGTGHIRICDFTVSGGRITIGGGKAGLGSQGAFYFTGGQYFWRL